MCTQFQYPVSKYFQYLLIFINILDLLLLMSKQYLLVYFIIDIVFL